MRHSIAQTSRTALLLMPLLLPGCTLNVSLGSVVEDTLSPAFDMASVEPASATTPMSAMTALPMQEPTGQDVGEVLVTELTKVAGLFARKWIARNGLDLDVQ